MDKSALLNEIVNHAKFKFAIEVGLIDRDTIKDHLYGIPFFRVINQTDLGGELLLEIRSVFYSNFDLVKTYFINTFADSDIEFLQEILEWIDGEYYPELCDALKFYDFHKLVNPMFMQVFNNHADNLIAMFEHHLNDLRDIHNFDLDTFEWFLYDFKNDIDCSNDINHIPLAVKCLNAYLDCENYYDDFVSDIDLWVESTIYS